MTVNTLNQALMESKANKDKYFHMKWGNISQKELIEISVCQTKHIWRSRQLTIQKQAEKIAKLSDLCASTCHNSYRNISAFIQSGLRKFLELSCQILTYDYLGKQWNWN